MFLYEKTVSSTKKIVYTFNLFYEKTVSVETIVGHEE